jgi:MarR family transcriptional regulator, negative regulator of the multidrug operon emrRAB
VSHTFLNAFGALSLAVADRVQEEMATVAGHGASGPAALVALDGEAGGRSIDALRQILGITHSGTVRLVDRLTGAGLVERRIGSDARTVALHLTPQGRRLAGRVLAAREAALEQVLAPLSTAQRRQIEPLFAAMVDALEDGRICRMCDAGRCQDCPNYKARLER